MELNEVPIEVESTAECYEAFELAFRTVKRFDRDVTLVTEMGNLKVFETENKYVVQMNNHEMKFSKGLDIDMATSVAFSETVRGELLPE